MINREGNLLVLDDVVLDNTLPKHKADENGNSVSPTGGRIWLNQSGGISGSNEDASDWAVFDSQTGIRYSGKSMPFISLLRNIANKFKRKPKTITIAEFFSSIKQNAENIELVEERLKGYYALLERAKTSGQVALVEKLIKNIEIVKYETQLMDAGFKVAISEENIVKFYKESKKGLRLDWVKNFSRMIPCDIVDTKVKLDALKVFDNYVVMHYDPEAKSYAMTNQEIEDAKDPILFGIIEGSRKLYFVGDWIDEVCDLTLDELVTELGGEGIDEHTLKVNVYGDINGIPCEDEQ
jgi:hypothetical protein